MKTLEQGGFSDSLVDLLLSAGFIKETQLSHGSQTLIQMNRIMSMTGGFDQVTTKKYALTNVGFHYVLLDTPT